MTWEDVSGSCRWSSFVRRYPAGKEGGGRKKEEELHRREEHQHHPP